MFSEIKNKFFNKTQIQPLTVKLIQVETKSAKIEQEQIKKPIQSNNKLITCYEEDYTRNNTEIMKLWQRN
jgi:hypothetical protein